MAMRRLPPMPEILPPETPPPPDAAPGVAVFATADGSVRVEVRLQGGTVWLSQKQLAQLYGVTVSNINKHLKAIFEDGELEPARTIEHYSIVATNGKHYTTKHYNLDAVLHVGYRVRSTVGALFRAWATERLTEYMVKGFTMNDDQLKYGDGYEEHFRELLARIRDIRASEKLFYQQVRDLIAATSVDYARNKNEEPVRNFFAHLQDCMLYAVSGHTAAELKFLRADGTKPHMGLTCFRGGMPCLTDADVAKNYLTAAELADMNQLVTMFLDHAEMRARRHQDMTLADWQEQARRFLEFNERSMLSGYGTRRSEDAKQYVRTQYAIYRQRCALEEAQADAAQDAEDAARLAALECRQGG
ncbi:RhuM family protein [uncultured Desulfovibrio sp.]|uniref:RhuM family protein n=1 Tax=uncultured Desulfovibrio sp. TaxID=167968 RepID=UPI00260C2A29|nr:RhuM family protein [uncultured Desulfovibrio sp.]